MNLYTPINLLSHSAPCFGGLLKRYDPGLARARIQLLLKNKFEPFVTKEGYTVENKQQLYCYFDFSWEAIVFRGGWPDQLSHQPTIIDIGANYGTFGWLCRKRWPNARIIGFEPIPELANFCEKLGCYDQMFPVALAEKTGTATLFLDRSLGLTASLGGNPLLDFKSGKLDVTIERLDDFHIKPDFIKMDVDGGELKTVVGGLDTFRACPLAVVECIGRQRHKTIQDILQKKTKRLYVLSHEYLFYDEGLLK
jgi:FkbM family methyltransferase